MLKQIFTRPFIQHLLISDGGLILLIILYNLLSLLIPLVRISLGSALLIFILANLLICGLKATTFWLNQQSQP
ncbi:hypothetical protein [Limosilactobacillus sp.]|jgi:hypothetical protein|uniref:hypothetical protein n=1 Tax=Limosilactobacillus sp. TaxID=2773925 RepID=UPI0025C71377|nr:hypothetical protein [Limosilactobacillus sp.]MCH3921442.1 hypothetical protein [Limosilactobacillus sp.]MCH3928213.1 hypothetical protein [Limosilactobacillus sp.]